MRFLLSILILFSGILASSGCATSPQRPQGAELPGGPRLVILGEMPASGVVRATDLMPVEAGMWQYVVVAGDDPGRSLEIRRVSTDEHGATLAHEEGEARTEYWNVASDGSLQLTAVYEADDRAISFFDPPFTIPAELKAGQVHSEQSAMRVLDARNRSVQKAAGTARRTVEYVDNQQIETPLGVMEAQRVLVQFRAELGTATAETATTIYVVPGLGMVAEQSSERVKILGVFGRSSDRTIVLVRGS